MPHAHADGMAFLVSRGEPEVQPPGHVRWIEYEGVDAAAAWIERHRDRIQVVSARPGFLQTLPEAWAHCPLGSAQRPPLDWRPDGIDTLGAIASF